jgi:hypothetical protein
MWGAEYEMARRSNRTTIMNTGIETNMLKKRLNPTLESKITVPILLLAGEQNTLRRYFTGSRAS